MPWKDGPPPLYCVWRSMIDRCYNKKFRQYKDYGGRGITVCNRWRYSFKNFLLDMGPRPKGLLLDRIDNNGNYKPKNCRWTTRQQQQRNQTVTRKVTIKGKTYIAADLADTAGMKTDTIVERAQRGLSYKKVISPVREWNLEGLKLGGQASGKMKRALTHCKRGHEFTPENTRITPEGWRACRACHAAKMRHRTAAKKSAAIPRH
jgi:hypothetical protein